jgi:hypothetical protein
VGAKARVPGTRVTGRSPVPFRGVFGTDLAGV